MDFRKAAFRGVRWTALSSTAKSLIQILQLIILSRLLVPADFGVYALVVALMAIPNLFSDLGISAVLIHKQDISDNQRSSVYWLNIAVNLALALLIILTSAWVSELYDSPQLQMLLIVSAIALLISAFAQQVRVFAQKEFRFAQLALVDITVSLVFLGSAVTIALNGGGVMSFVVGGLVAAIAGLALAWIVLANGWRPILRLKLNEITEVIKIGRYVLGNNVVSSISSQVDILIGGRMVNADALGGYSLPKDLNLRISGLINPIATTVGFPILARVQDEPQRLKDIYLFIMRMTASVNFPIYISLCFFAPEIVNLLLGAKWHESVLIVQLLAIWGLLRSILYPVGYLLLAKGRADTLFKWNLVWLLVTIPVVYTGSLYGVAGMSVAMLFLTSLHYFPTWRFLVFPSTGASFREYMVQHAVPLVLTLLTTSLAYLLTLSIGQEWLGLVTGMVLVAVIYLALSLVFNKPWVEAMVELLTRYREAD